MRATERSGALQPYGTAMGVNGKRQPVVRAAKNIFPELHSFGIRDVWRQPKFRCVNYYSSKMTHYSIRADLLSCFVPCDKCYKTRQSACEKPVVFLNTISFIAMDVLSHEQRMTGGADTNIAICALRKPASAKQPNRSKAMIIQADLLHNTGQTASPSQICIKPITCLSYSISFKKSSSPDLKTSK